MEEDGKKKSAFDKFKGFPKIFWIANTLELFERGAYYGMMAVLSYHLVFNLGFSESVPGAIMTLLLPLLYFVPLISGALAKKYGFKNTLIFAFIVLGSSYFVLSQLQGLMTIILIMISLGIGAGAFKPMISATIALSTREDQRNLGYSIYYWSINFAAAIIPFIIGVMVPEHLYSIVFILSGVLITFNLLITIFKFDDPAPPDKNIDIFKALKNILIVIKDFRFVTLLIIYSGFWVLFSQMHIYLPIYMPQFKVMPAWFTVPFLSTINPGTIIILGPFLGRFADKYNAMKVMSIGMLIFIAGWTLTGLIPISMFFLFGIFLFSIGEFLTHPNFISYTSKIAPQDRVAIYMSCIFLSTGSGQMIGAFSSSILYPKIAVDMGRPNFFWAIYICVAVLSGGLLLIFNRVVNRKKREEEQSLLPKKKRTSEKKDFFNSKFTPVGLFAFIPIILLVSWSIGPLAIVEDSDDEWVFEPLKYDLTEGPSFSLSGSASENGEETENQLIELVEGELLASITIELTWFDEPDRSAGLGFRTLENQPDEFSMDISLYADPKDETTSTITASEGPSSNPRGSQGLLTFRQEFDHQNDISRNGTGLWAIIVNCHNCGDYQGAVLSESDSGNSYEISITTEIFVPEKYLDP